MRRILSCLFLIIVPVLLFAQKQVQLPGYSTTLPFSSAEIVVPVVVHIITAGNEEPISMEQVHAQIEALNRDYNAGNADRLNTPEYFKNLVASVGIRFELAKVDPGGRPSSGVVYKRTSRGIFNLDDKVKFSVEGGDDAWPFEHYLNIWVCPMLSSIRGYSTNPGGSAKLDGVVLNQQIFGTLYKSSQHNLGRIAVHEIGHWLGLKHIWGDGYCGDDGVDDTPPQKSYNTGCPTGILKTCGNTGTGDMYMNFMDLTNDACMFMFTNGQKIKIRESFEVGHPRHSILVSGALGEPGNAIDPNWGKDAKPDIIIQQVKLWPVPATGLLHIELSGSAISAGKSLVIYNMSGQPLLSVPVSGKLINIDVSSLRGGQYLVKIPQTTAAPAKFVKL